MPKVLIRSLPTLYEDYSALKGAVSGLLDELGTRAEVGGGKSVLIKPNLLAPAAWERAVTTHPLVIRAVVEYVLSAGGRPTVADSSAVAPFERILRETGTAEALEGLDVECVELDDPCRVTVERLGIRYPNLDIARRVLEADVVMNLPKYKTHSQMMMTLAVKNCFGHVVGMEKPEWHYRVGEDVEAFAGLLTAVYLARPPEFNLVDGLLAMEGNGPGSGGTSRRLGYLLASRSAVALDRVAPALVGIEAGELPINRACARLGLWEDDIEIDGQYRPIEGWKMPRPVDLLFGPRLTRGLLRRHITRRPAVKSESCRLCLECVKICPAGALTFEREKKKLEFDYNRCIRCYCCIEACPHAAMEVREPLLRRLLAERRAWPFFRRLRPQSVADDEERQ